MKKETQKIIPNLWFDPKHSGAEEAVEFYTSIFENSQINTSCEYTEAGREFHRQEPGTVMTIDYQLENYKMVALNGGPYFKFNPSISFFVNCSTKAEVDRLWEKLSDGGKALMPLDKYSFSERYGWIQDKYGVSWQLIFSEDEAQQKIIPSLMFVGKNCGKAGEAINFYTSVFKNSKLGGVFRYGAEQEPDKEGTIMYADFKLENQLFAAMDSAHEHDFNLNEAISFIVNCENQEEIDYYWEKLSAVPEAEQCGWLKDKFGVSWQVVPAGMEKMLNGPDKGKAIRAMEAVMKMKKFDIKELNKAFEGNN